MTLHDFDNSLVTVTQENLLLPIHSTYKHHSAVEHHLNTYANDHMTVLRDRNTHSPAQDIPLSNEITQRQGQSWGGSILKQWKARSAHQSTEPHGPRSRLSGPAEVTWVCVAKRCSLVARCAMAESAKACSTNAFPTHRSGRLDLGSESRRIRWRWLSLANWYSMRRWMAARFSNASFASVCRHSD